MSWSKSYASVDKFEAGEESYPTTGELNDRQKQQVEVGRDVAGTLLAAMRAEDPEATEAEFSISISGHANDAPSPGDYQSVSISRIVRVVVPVAATFVDPEPADAAVGGKEPEAVVDDAPATAADVVDATGSNGNNVEVIATEPEPVPAEPVAPEALPEAEGPPAGA